MDFSKCQFSVIYSVDVPEGTKLIPYRPSNLRKLNWEITESGGSEYDYLEGDWKKGRHRKYCTVLNFEQFCDFIDKTGLYPEKCSTGGSIGAPGFGFGWAPAVCFQSDDYYAIQSAYVTPIIPRNTDPLLPNMPEDVDDLNWDSVEKEMWEWFEDGSYSAKERSKELVTLSDKI